eukprot:6457251-Prymnesium_polylepis.1
MARSSAEIGVRGAQGHRGFQLCVLAGVNATCVHSNGCHRQNLIGEISSSDAEIITRVSAEHEESGTVLFRSRLDVYSHLRPSDSQQHFQESGRSA